ncbi:DNA -binding domain-containing protein [Brevundimonas sp. UBA5936]|uniref:DNA -binding domain-containing protein n=1 Tax=Brevundimonas sp. UBA5936 TaxID=1946133 RepID=UPI0025C01FEC|nr:DUF2285 domain-containing protein [Brevundimonas sp. UBA5936]
MCSVSSKPSTGSTDCCPRSSGGNHGRTVGRWPFGPGTVGETAPSQREIAIALFGPDLVTTDWSTDDDMRKRIVRLLRTGERLIAAAGPELLRRTAP